MDEHLIRRIQIPRSYFSHLFFSSLSKEIQLNDVSISPQEHSSIKMTIFLFVLTLTLKGILAVGEYTLKIAFDILLSKHFRVLLKNNQLLAYCRMAYYNIVYIWWPCMKYNIELIVDGHAWSTIYTLYLMVIHEVLYIAYIWWSCLNQSVWKSSNKTNHNSFQKVSSEFLSQSSICS